MLRALALLLALCACRSAADSAVDPDRSAKGEAARAELRLMTFNIRYGTARDGAHRWEERRERVAARIREAAPDVLALQEGLVFQLEELAPVLAGYRKIGQHREGGLEGEFSGLFVHEQLEVLDQGEFWFSEQPQLAGSQSWDSSLPRMCAWVVVPVGSARLPVRIYGTHYDHRGATARAMSTRMILADSATADPVVVMGDLNAAEGDDPVAGYLSRGFRSAVLEHDPSVTRGTMNAFRHEDGGAARIDHVLVRGPLEVVEAAILGGSVDGLFPSDHDAVTAVLRPTP
ncbi:MAG: endonuclease/exonuclease/phosphatase family protein [Planctomycetota bacterium]|nr:endonuclease/exonuclease/phosphatase family protein [Planctomycetota bacterium]